MKSHTPIARSGYAVKAAPPMGATLFDLPEPLYGQGTFEKLRLVRLRLAKERDVAAFKVFPDTTLRLIAASLPRNEQELLRVRGVGPQKAKEYGGAFLEAIAALQSA